MNIVAILNILSFFFPLLWLAIILVFYFKTRELNFGLIKYGILTVLALYFLQGSYLTAATYNAWKLDPVGHLLLPPSTPINYFLGYAYFNFWRIVIINIFMGAIWAGFLFLIKRFTRERVLDNSDIALGFFTAMVVGWPKIFAYFVVFFWLLILKATANSLIFKNKNNLTIASSIVFSALIVAGFSNLIMRIPFFDNFKL
jgi:hypothetical protein